MIREKQKEGFLRGAGVLMPISSLPSDYGIGSLGREAFRFADDLKEAGQKYWQVLPVGPTSFGDSPYQSFSAFAGNPYFIDLETLMEEGLLTKKQADARKWGEDAETVDYSLLYRNRSFILKKAYKKSRHKGTAEYEAFLEENAFWLEDYSLYMAVKEKEQGREWSLWEEDIRFREEKAVAAYKKLLAEEMDFFRFCQFKFRQQWKKLRGYVNGLGIQIIGDVPLYVAMDSADVWVHGEWFELDEQKQPIHVAGVPPDLFSEDGQRWGNPLYRWDAMERDGFKWWRERMKSNAQLYDAIRIDHFIGMVRYYCIPASSPTAVKGRFRKGPGSKLTDAVKESIGGAGMIAEDLGILTPEVRRLIRKTGWAGMKVLEFAFDGNPGNEYLPHNYKSPNSIVYIGTHDNETLAGFIKGMAPKERAFLLRYLGVKRSASAGEALIRTAYASIADVAVIQMQDILGLDNKARMNTPSTSGENWRWRMKKEAFTEEEKQKLKELARLYGRIETERKEENGNIDEGSDHKGGRGE